MKVALIPPKCRLGEKELYTGYHLLLPAHCSDKEHLSFYQMRRAAGDFLILDNGACEGSLVDTDELMRWAHTYMVNEVVIPDTLGDMEATITQADKFGEVASRNHEFNYMGVLQGQTMGEFKECADQLREMHWISTFAVPRHIETTCYRGARLELVNYLYHEHDDRDIHLLGLNPKHIAELASYGPAYNLNNVRGVDTAAPYYYAMKCQYMAHMEAVTRPDDYFTQHVWMQHEVYIQNNVAMLLMWAGR